MKRLLRMHPEGVRLNAAMRGQARVRWLDLMIDERCSQATGNPDFEIAWSNIRTYISGALQDARHTGDAFLLWLATQQTQRIPISQNCPIDLFANRLLGLSDARAFCIELVALDSLAAYEISGQALLSKRLPN